MRPRGRVNLGGGGIVCLDGITGSSSGERELTKTPAHCSSTDEATVDHADTVARLLERWNAGDREAADELVPLLYDELHRLAAGYVGRERASHTLQATAVVHEAYLRLVGQRKVRFCDRAHFIGVAAHVMRRVLVDYSRDRGRVKRGGRLRRLTLVEAADLCESRHPDLVELDDALAGLAKVDPRKASIVELRYFGGLTIDEIAEVLDLAPRTVSREWRRARAWLYHELCAVTAGENGT